jgi:hypothetical protein
LSGAKTPEVMTLAPPPPDAAQVKASLFVALGCVRATSVTSVEKEPFQDTLTSTNACKKKCGRNIACKEDCGTIADCNDLCCY